MRYSCSGGSQFSVTFNDDSVQITTKSGNRYTVALVMQAETETRFENGAVLFVRRKNDSSFHIGGVLHRGCREKNNTVHRRVRSDTR
jgi:hypothetical protein